MKTEKQFTAVEWFNHELIERQNGNGDSRSRDEIFEEAKEIEYAQHQLLKMQIEKSQKKENQFVLNMPFKIEPLTREIGTISDGVSHTEIKNVGYVIKDAKCVEYFFYEKDGELVYDGWCAGFEQK